ncbi:LOW QUALITY PROTEIN: metalloproteinase, extracellular matrix glycoprotein VMP29, partial [Volvox carteri f. nagariensis]
YQRLLVMVLDYPACGFPATITEEEIRTLYLGPNGDGKGGLAEKYTQCSYGKFNLNITAFRAVRVTHQCSPPITTSCAAWAMSTKADAATKPLIGPAAFSSFSHYTYIVPPGLCPWSGLAYLPGRQAFLQTSANGVYRWATIMQEALHNYGMGLYHSWQNGIEYGDYSTAMGRGNACPNAAEISRMGWATPAVGGDQLNSSALLPGTTKTFVLPATYLTGSNNYLRVTPDWLSMYNDSKSALNLYMAVRVAREGDAGLGQSYASKVNIHEVNATMDNGLPNLYANSDRKIQFINAVSPMSQLTLDVYNLVVYGGSWVDTDTLRVHLCRFKNSPFECPSLGDLEGIEYGDYSTAMGRGTACPNAAEISRMGWATPAVGGDQLNSSALLPGTTKTFVLPATYLTGSNNYLRVTPDWLSMYNDSKSALNLYMAVRVAREGDAGLGQSYASKVNIHEVNATMDNGLPNLYANSDRKIQFINAVSPMSQLTLDVYNLVVYGGSWVDTDTLRVHLCRFKNSPFECPSLGDLE